jgi:hydroxymethylbilane synthase
MDMIKPLKIGTRGSPLALAQTQIFIDALTRKHPDLKEPGAIEVVKITTSGDLSQKQNVPLPAEGGGKALFAKEIEDALQDGRIDCGVHSLKDLPPVLPAGLVVASVLPRDDPRDAFFSSKSSTIEGLPQGAVFGSCSPRRQAIVLALRPDLKIAVFRGNVDTRLRKLEEGVVDATTLAVAGLKRLGRADLLTNILPPDVMLPAAAQGAIGIETREKDARTRDLVASVNCAISEMRVTAERAFLRVMDGSCRTPLAALMEEPDPEGRARFDILAATPDGRSVKRLSYLMAVKHVGDADRLGAHAGMEMKRFTEKFSTAC